MKKKTPQPTIEEQQRLTIDACIQTIISTSFILADYIAKYELYGTLTREDDEFLNAVAIARQKYMDTNQLNQVTKEK